MFDNMLSSPIIGILPFLIIIHIAVGIWAAIKEKRFELKSLPDFMFKGLIFFGFLLILDITYTGFVDSDLGEIAISGVQTLRGIAWLAIVCYYVSKIYGNLIIIGMPRLNKVETELDKEIVEEEKAVDDVNNANEEGQ